MVDDSRVVSKDELRILLIGKTGVGKSTTANTILNQKLFKTSAISQSVTTQCQWGKRLLNGQSVVVVDTPGLFDTRMSMEETMIKIAAFTGMISPGPHAIVLVLEIGQRYTTENQKTVQLFCKLFGEGIFNNMIILFTFREKLQNEEEVKSFSDYLDTLDENLKDVIRRAGNRCIAFGKGEDAKRTNDPERLIDLINTNIGKTYYSNELLRKIEQTNRRIRTEMKHESIENCSDEELISKLRTDYTNQGPWFKYFLNLAKDILLKLADNAWNIIVDAIMSKYTSKL